MSNYIKSFFNIFSLFPSSKNYDELTLELNNSMQDLYDKMGWGQYIDPLSNFTIVQKQKMHHNKPRIDPARPRINKYYDRQQYK